ncbi:autophagy-related protein 18b isoform X3 [Juglans microcarpa x Juglans regia]|uniref:autophagy-related protein 18b isoform X3 n=1 Tax=Juglans microcarpa x Juglans regia TaxID=2249226 RepID=UPI001B7EE410|nr:autophagy-related protein 18b isoform X3 [Juglans microcarpa x Juglans regia]
MANQSSSSSSSSSYPILCASFNQDASHFVIGTREGFKVFDSNTGRLCYERAIGAFIVVEMLFTSSLLAIVGAGEQVLGPCYLQRLIVILQDKTYVYDINKVKILDAIDTVPNLKGLCGFSPSLDGCFLALPASITKGSVLLYNVMELQSHCEIDAHRAPLAAIVLCSNGMHIATASEQGTIIRVHLVSDATKSYSFRRGRYPSTIFSLSFAPSMQIPDILVATSSSGSLHVFSLGFALNQRSRKSSTILGSIIPDSITDVLDPAHRHVLHSAVTAGVKSNAVIRKVDKVADASTPGIASCKATISIITYNGYFQEYSFRLNYQNEPLWTLEHEFNLLSPVSDNASS